MYPVLAEPRTLVHQPTESIVITEIKDIGEVALVVNELAGDILECCDGTRSREDILSALIAKGTAKFLEFDAVSKFLDEASTKGLVSMQNTPANAPVRVLGSRHHWTPSMIVLELTHYCNLYCEYCYREAGDSNCEGFANTHRVKQLIREMAELGIRRIQLTGGEPTMHPEFPSIVELCLEEGLFVNVVTNGYNVSKECKRALQSIDPRRGVVQVSIDGSRVTHDIVRNKRGSYDDAVQLVTTLVEHDVVVDVAATVWGQSHEDLEHVCQLAKKLGARSFRASPLFEAGRAVYGSNRIAQDIVVRSLKALAEAYCDDAFIVGSTNADCSKESHRTNICGAGSRVLRITPSFVVKPCPLLDYSIGEVADRSLKEFLMTKKGDLDRLISPSRAVCGQCDKVVECDGCFKRAMSISEEVEDCGWRKANSNTLTIFA